MKKIYAFILIGFFCLLSIPLVSAAEDISADDQLSEYILSDDGKNAVSSVIEEAINSRITGDYDNELQISEPFCIPIYNAPDKKLYKFDDEKYSICYSNKKPVGLIRYICSENDIPKTRYYAFPDDFSLESFSLFSYGWVRDINGNALFGGNDCKIIMAADDNEKVLVYYGENDFISIDNKNLKAVINENFPVIDYSELKKYNSFEGTFKPYCSVKTSQNKNERFEKILCSIVNAETKKALTYKNGKYMADEPSNNNDGQKFIITRVNGGYKISPYTNNKKNLRTKNGSTFQFNCSYFGQNTYKIIDKSGRSIKLNNGRIVSGQYNNTDMYGDWIIVVREQTPIYEV